MSKFLRSCATACALFVSISAAFGTIRYVSPLGSNGAGTSWATAKTTLQAACASASPGDEFWVAKGNYTWSLMNNIVVPYDCSFYGGFAGNEVLRTQRNPNVNVSKISGSGSIAALNIVSSLKTVVVDGFLFQGNTVGGGCVHIHSGTGQVTNNKFIANTGSYVGSAIYADGCTILIAQNSISWSKCQGPDYSFTIGGAIVLDACVSRVESCAFYNNVTFQGWQPTGYSEVADIYAHAGSLKVINCTFDQQWQVLPASLTGWAAVTGDLCAVQCSNNIFRDTTANGGHKKVRLTSGSYSGLSGFNCWNLASMAPIQGGAVAGSDFYANPMLVAAGNPHLLASSPCRNTGNNAFVVHGFDIDGQTRIQSNVERGADEFQEPQWPFDWWWATTAIAPRPGLPVILEFFPVGSTDRAAIMDLETGNDMRGTIVNAPVPPGDYDILFSAPGYLKQAIRAVTVGGQQGTLAFSPIAGDANGDNVIDASDYFILSDSYGLSSGSTTFDPRSDFNYDGTVDAQDYFMLSDGYDTQGDTPLSFAY